MVEHLAYLLSGLPSAFVGQMATLWAKYHRDPIGQRDVIVGSVDAGLHNAWAAECMEACSHTVAYVVTDNKGGLEVLYMACMAMVRSAVIDIGKSLRASMTLLVCNVLFCNHTNKQAVFTLMMTLSVLSLAVTSCGACSS